MDGRMIRQLKDRITPRTASETESATAQLLEGFTSQEIARLVRVRTAFAQGCPLDTTPEFNRLRFARWLVEHHRLDG